MRLVVAVAVGLGLVALMLMVPKGAGLAGATPDSFSEDAGALDGVLMVAERAASGDSRRVALDPGHGPWGTQSSVERAGAIDEPPHLSRRVLARLVRERAVQLPELDPESLEQKVERLLLDLRDDETYGNATRARRHLSLLGADAVPALRRTLTTDDAQQRLHVVSLLLAAEVEVDGQFLAAVSRNLEGDEFERRVHADDTQGTRTLIKAGSASWDVVRLGLSSGDPQRRFLSAVVLAHTRCPRNVALTVTILAGHLRDNHWRGDAGVASRALFAMGDLAVPNLERLRGMPGLQARRLVALVLSELEVPSQTEHAAFERARRMAPGKDGRPLTVWRFQPDIWFGLQD